VIPPLQLLELHFKTLAPIRKLPHFHGCHWSALLREMLKQYLPVGVGLADAGIAIQSVETGINTYEAGDAINLGLSFFPEHHQAISKCLDEFNSQHVNSGHFQPGVTIQLEQVYCRISQQQWNPNRQVVLTEELLAVEIDQLCNIQNFTLRFISPTRLTRPATKKQKGHRYCDEVYFSQREAEENPLGTIFQRLRHCPQEAADSLKICQANLYWLDVSYGKKVNKSIGGFVGEIQVRGTPDRHQAKSLILGQYGGAGKNFVFGFGYYTIPEVANISPIMPCKRGCSLLQRALDLPSLKEALKQLPNSSPGWDKLTVPDYRSAGDQALLTLAEQAWQITNFSRPVKSYKIPKSDGGSRQIQVQNAGERIVHRSLSNLLSPTIDRLLSNCSYAYRRGLSRRTAAREVSRLLEQGYHAGIKADIDAFFDSVSSERLLSLLSGLFPFEPAIDLISNWLSFAEKSGVSGLPQGGSLSPVLSNLFLDRFDRNMQDENFRLVRYADDFILFLPPEFNVNAGLEKVKLSLSRLGLQLNSTKTSILHGKKSIKFLGCLISATGINDDEKELPIISEGGEWSPLFKDDWDIGQPVYLSTLCRGAKSKGSHLVVQNDQGENEKISWNRISRIVVVGRSPLSGGVYYRCVKEDIPITFIDIIGRTRGQLLATSHVTTDLSSLQATAFCVENITLPLSREIVAAKIINSQAVLRRNDASRPQLNQLAARAKQATTFDQLRGFEGAAAKIYFSAFATLVSPFTFNGRVYRPPDGPVNAMLSFGYTLLYHRIAAVLREKGFNPRQGFYHQGRGNHSALASDLQEELRHLVERIVLALIHLKEIQPDDFVPYHHGGIRSVRLTGEGFRTFVRRFERTMEGKFNYGKRGQISYNGYLDEMAEALRRSLKLQIPYTALRIR